MYPDTITFKNFAFNLVNLEAILLSEVGDPDQNYSVNF